MNNALISGGGMISQNQHTVQKLVPSPLAPSPTPISTFSAPPSNNKGIATSMAASYVPSPLTPAHGPLHVEPLNDLKTPSLLPDNRLTAVQQQHPQYKQQQNAQQQPQIVQQQHQNTQQQQNKNKAAVTSPPSSQQQQSTNILPEDGSWCNVLNQTAEQSFIDFTVEETDWAIGEGFEMDLS